MDPSGSGADVEAPKDPGALKSHPSLSDNEILGKKAGERKKNSTIFNFCFSLLPQATAMCTLASTCRARAAAPATGTTTAATGAALGTGTTGAGVTGPRMAHRITDQVRMYYSMESNE